MRVCGVGDNVVDRYFNQKLMFPGGNAVNFAVHAQRSGLQAAYIGVIGTDPEGDLIRSSLQAEGLELTRLRVVEGPNAFATVHMDDDGNNRKWGLCEKGVSVFQLDSPDLDYLAAFDLVHTGETSLLDRHLPELRERVAISFDFSDRNLEYAAGLLPHVKAAAFSRANADDDEVACVLEAAQSAGVELVTITQGARGATVCHKGEILFVPAVPINAVDTLGAGDAFVSRLVCRVLTGVPLAEAAYEAAGYSALICTMRGGFGHARLITRDIPS
ncbi:carbohydrate kinase [Pseudomonas prosekii]|uniref:Carbohydrate kinase n=1 Tax=Pseudomonas prosekii TaxID=1148509 RepID=A0A3L8CMP8_9PSED|nr:PfkB family carbohydrate kinase [Pseudomonas prosekii]RLU09131.1 carbohydrate kinase [Pseudomonas prosekii]RLU11953.1 carbohydrate kinase [Pseudomonas prosekii]